jgi:glutathione S-transferase
MPPHDTAPATATDSHVGPPRPSHPLIFYDIALRPPVTQHNLSPNPWKTRLTLNYLGLPYKTTWVPLLDISKTRLGLHVSAVRQFADGTDFYTLPILTDPTTGTTTGDSFDITMYLDKTYPSPRGSLFPPIQLGFTMPPEKILVPLTEPRSAEAPYKAYADFNVHVDAAFSAHVGLTTQNFPFDPAVEAECQAEFVRRAAPYVTSWEGFFIKGEAREAVFKSFEEVLGRLAEDFQGGGPFVRGRQVCYADFIIGGWLRMLWRSLPREEWERVRGWQGGLWGRLHDALEAYADTEK